MKCPTCNAWTSVLDTRETRRRRECANGHRFTTREVLTSELDYAAQAQRAKLARQVLRDKGYLR